MKRAATKQTVEHHVQRTNVLGVGVSSLDMDGAVETLIAARRRKVSGYVCVTGVHGVIESQRDPELKRIHNNSFLTVPDGMPTVWMGREQGFSRMDRVYGPDLMSRLVEATATEPAGADDVKGKSGATEARDQSSFMYPSQEETGTLELGARSDTSSRLTHFLFGATEEMLELLKSNLEKRFPAARVVGVFAPPFRPLNESEETALREKIAVLKPDFFWVGLSTPKQERFMSAHANNPDFGIMLGVGAAFPIHAGLQKDAPEWIKKSGFQWLYRLCQDPRRLWRRYLHIVPTFIALATAQVLGLKEYEIEK